MGEIIHYIIVIPLILLIIYYQIRVFVQASHKIESFKSIFPTNKHAYSISKVNIITNDDELYPHKEEDNAGEIWRDDEDEDEDELYSKEIEVSQISVPTDNSTLSDIKAALNMYLQKNRGAASDFALMKDVVERYCGAEEEEITVMQPIPLYMGLMGTMIGIIVGISIIAANGGVSSLTNVSSMMTCVAIAMVASLAGIIFTTIISWRSKGAKTQVEARKNEFYSWLQTELLPVLSGNTLTALSLLQTNLMTFNQTFKGNIKEFDSVLANVRQVSRDQADALGAISRIDITRVAQANVTVLRELQKSTTQLERFNQYLVNVNGYLDAVNSLNTNLNNHLDRTAAVERMGEFFERELNQVQQREELIKQVVDGVDNTLHESFNQMVDSMNNYITELKNKTTSDLDTIRDAYEQRQRDFVSKLQAQQDLISKKSEEMERVVQSMANLSETKQAISSLSSISRDNARRLDQIIETIQSSGATPTQNAIYGVAEGSRRKKKNWKETVRKIFDITVKSAIAIAALLYAIDFISKYLIK